MVEGMVLVRLAVIGCAHPHVRMVIAEANASSTTELVAISDPDRSLAERYAPGARYFADHRELLATMNVDVVATAGIYSERAAVIVDALAAGANVLADKPMCTTPEQLWEIETAAERTGRTVSVLFEKRFWPVTMAAREVVNSGEIGEIVQIAATGPHKLLRDTRPDWFFDRAQYGGIVGDLAVHDIDLALFFSGMRSGWLIAQNGNAANTDRPEFTDHGAVLLVGDTATATLEVNWLTADGSDVHGEYQLRLTGTEGTVELFFARGRVRIVSREREPRTLELADAPRGARNALEAFAAGRTPEVDTAASIAATRLALLAQQSADEGGRRIEWSL